MIIGSISCPWGKKKVDLSKKQLTVLEKTWFVQEMIMGRKNARELAEIYNLKSETVRGWKKKYDQQGFLKVGVGRRRIYDKQLVKIAPEK